MTSEVDLYGVYLPFPLVAGLIAGLLLALLRPVLLRVGFYRRVWHPALVDVALYTLLLAATVLVSRGLSPRL
ncbi:DUF1656 domain-containing protein [Corallococcus sp. RDP092CA]|uniref:DUF1656 domain-containing protein n=1 Tax=Corallococcus sp. RDP092CA TaxID=3109369 RepID=UPI0035B3FAB2